MAEKIESEKAWLQSIVIPKMFESGSFNKNIQRIIDFYDLRIRKVEIKFIGAEESFMLTNCYRATVEYEVDGQHSKIHLVVKKTPILPEDIYNEINFGALFSNEIVAYEILKPAIEQFTKQPFEIPDYFYSDVKSYSASIVLEDFGTKGWRVPTDKYNLSLEHLLVSVKYLGHFHGIGFAMRKIQRKEFNDIASQLKESRYGNKIPDDLTLSMKYGIQRLFNATRKYEAGVDDEFLRKLEELIHQYYGYGVQRVRPIEPFITICHGDFLRNNLAFRYIIKDGKELPSEVMMFDLQTMRISSPMVDMVYLLSLSAFSEVRCKNFELIFKTYRKELVKIYENLTKDNAPDFLSFDSLIKEFIRYMPFGIQIASFFLFNLVEPPTVTADQFLVHQLTIEEMISDIISRGGQIVDRELSHQVKELYELTIKYNVDISEGINVDEYKL